MHFLLLFMSIDTTKTTRNYSFTLTSSSFCLTILYMFSRLAFFVLLVSFSCGQAEKAKNQLHLCKKF